MTTIAWDGKTLAADKRGVNAGWKGQVCTKIRRTRDGHLLAITGELGMGSALMDWFEAGCDPKAFPDEKDTTSMLVITPAGEIFKYEGTRHRMKFEVAQFAMGTGRDYALAAMHLGCDARRAVEVAAHFDTATGNGIDTLRLETASVKAKQHKSSRNCALSGAKSKPTV